MEAITSRDLFDTPHSADAVVQLRRWASDETFVLPAGTTAPITLGSSSACTWRFTDTQRYISRVHAELTYEAGRWTLRDRGSKNRVHFDGSPRSEMTLEPGVEIRLGALVLVAESERTIILRGYLQRLLGWHSRAAATVDLALRSIRTAMSHRAALILRGEGGLVACAEELHRFACGKDAPFIVCDPRRRRGPATVRAPANRASIEDALPFASGGSLCVLARRPPVDLAAAIPDLLAPDSTVLLMICGMLTADSAFASTVICIPSVADREAEIDRVIEEASASAAEDLGATKFALSPAECVWIRARCAGSIAEIATAARRLIALREGGTVAAGASLLGMSHVALGEWFARRRGPKDRIGIW